MKTLGHSLHRSSALCTCAALCIAGFSAPQALALPTGATVVSGHVTTSQPTSSQEVITQTTGKAIVNWSSFDIGTTESVKVIEPSASSIQLDRVTSGSPTQILGSLSANGQVWLVNPNGVFFGPSAQVNVAGLIASTANISNANFLAGNYTFDSPGSASASIVNQGTITAAQGGLVALVAPGVVNSGTITAKYGTVALGAGQTFSIALDLYGDGLYSFTVDSAATQLANDQNGNPLAAAITNTGTISAGRVYLTADAAANVVSQAINTTGIVEATALHTENGVVVLDGSAGDVNVGGTVSVSGDMTVTGRNVTFTNAKVTSGRNFAVNASGNVSMTGSTINATGNLAVDNNGSFSSDTAGVLNGNAVWLHQSPSGSIQNAINAVGTTGTGGAMLWLDKGVWYENPTVTDANFTLSGSGASKSMIYGVVTYNNAPNGVIEYTGNNGIVLSNGSNSDIITNNIITANITSSFAISSSGSTGVNITDNILTSLGIPSYPYDTCCQEGIAMGDSRDFSSDGAIISGNQINNFQLSIALGGNNTKISNNIVSPNYTYIGGIAAWGNNVTISSNSTPTISLVGSNGNLGTNGIISNNIMNIYQTSGVSVIGNNFTVSDNTLYNGNIVLGEFSNLISVIGNHINNGSIGLIAANNITIDGNSINNNPAPNSGGISLSSSSANITNNTVSNSTNGIYFNFSSGNITGNTLTDNTSGIWLNNANDNITINSNHITGGTTGISSSGGDPRDYPNDDLTIKNNTISDMSTGISVIALTDNGGKGNFITGNDITSVTGDGIDIFADIYGITVLKSINTAVTNNTVSVASLVNAIGINANSSSNTTVSGNTVSYFATGVSFDYATGSITNNILSNNAIGINVVPGTIPEFVNGNIISVVASSNNVVVNGNSITGGTTGISANGDDDLTISKNTLSGMMTGISVTGLTDNGSKGNYITGNKLSDISGDGIDASDSMNLTIAGNTIGAVGANGILLTNGSNTIISDDTIANSGSGIISTNGIYAHNAGTFTIDGNTISNTESNSSDIFIDGSSSGVVEGNSLPAHMQNNRGITIDSASGPLTISNNTFDEINSFGIYAHAAGQTTISGNSFTGGTGSIALYNEKSNGMTISDNSFTGSGHGFGSIFDTYTNGTVISGNTFTITNASGTAQVSTDWAITLGASSNATVSNNTFLLANTDYSAVAPYVSPNLSGSGNTLTGKYPCYDGGGNSGSIGFVGGAHCP